MTGTIAYLRNFVEICSVFTYEEEADVMHKWLGIETFPMTPDQHLRDTTLGTIKILPFVEEDYLTDFIAWLNPLTYDDLPKHAWTDE